MTTRTHIRSLARGILGTVLLSSGLLCLAAAHAQQFPGNKTIRFVVPSAPGGQTDIVARYLSDQLKRQKGWTIVVDNRPGGNYVVGMQAVLNAPADGYTIFMGVSSLAILPSTVPNFPIDIKKDFATVSKLVTMQNALFAAPNTPYANLNEMIVYAKSNPGAVTFGSLGAGTNTSLAVEQLTNATNMKLTNVPYKDYGLINDVMTGVLQTGVVPPSNISQHVAAGKIKALAILGTKRSPLLPNVPSTSELGFAAVNGDGWLGIMVKADVPSHLVEILEREFRALLSQTEVRDRILGMGNVPVGSTAREFATELDQDMLRWTNFFKNAKSEKNAAGSAK